MHPTRTLAHDKDHLETQRDRLTRINEMVEILIENQKERIDHPYSDDIELPEDL